MAAFYFICNKTGAESKCQYTQLELAYNQVFIQTYIQMTFSYSIILIMKNEGLGRRGCCNRSRCILFRIVRAGLLCIYLNSIYLFVTRVFPLTWHLNKTIEWKMQDDLNYESFSWFNHIFCSCSWMLVLAVIYIYIFVLSVYAIVIAIFVFKGRWTELKQFGAVFLLLFRVLFIWIQTTITNESLALEVARAMGSNRVQDDHFEQADVREDFLKKHIKGYAETSAQGGMQQCTICILDFEPEDQVIELQCKHMFHTDCFDEYLQKFKANSKKCPNCRTDL